METISMLQLCDEHVQLRDLASKISAIVSQPAPSDWSELAPLRLSISKLIKQHIENEDRFMAKSMWSDGVPSELLGEWDVQRQAFRTTYSEHLRTWSLAEIGMHWDAYGKAVRERIASGETLMRFEEAEVYPLAERLNRQG